MKTFEAVFLSKKEKDFIRTNRSYIFNTEDEINIGDVIKCSKYHDPIEVVAILPESKMYYDKNTNMLHEQASSQDCLPIKEIKILDERKEGMITGYKKYSKR